MILVDIVFNILKDIEEYFYPDAVLIPGIKKSVQLDAYSCGAQCAYVILDYYDKSNSIDAVIKELGTNKEGTDTEPILKLFIKNGLNVYVNEKAKLTDIYSAIDNNYPILISVDEGEHWVVIYGYSDENIFVLDPSIKSPFCAWSKKKFRECWDNWIAVIKN